VHNLAAQEIVVRRLRIWLLKIAESRYSFLVRADSFERLLDVIVRWEGFLNKVGLTHINILVRIKEKGPGWPVISSYASNLLIIKFNGFGK
jgi:hypothetical protein